MRAIIDVLLLALDLYWWIVIAAALLSWLIAFNVINVRNDAVRTISNALYQMTEPVLARIRAFLPNFGAIDVSPIVLLLGIHLIKLIILYYIRPNVPF